MARLGKNMLRDSRLGSSNRFGYGLKVSVLVTYYVLSFPVVRLRVDIALHFVLFQIVSCPISVPFTVQECKQTKKMTSPRTNHVQELT